MARRKALIVINGLNEPSGTVRALQYQPVFERSEEWSATYIARRSATWSWRVDSLKRPGVPLMMPLIHAPAAAAMRRWERKREDEILRLAADVDLVYLVKVPEVRLYQRLRALNRPVVIADFNDAVWLPSFGLWRDIDGILKTAHGVICENPRVAEYARTHNRHVVVVPDAPQVEAFDRMRDRISRDPSRITFGWLGSPENAGSLYRIYEPLEALARRVPTLHLRILGADGLLVPRFESVQWSAHARFDQRAMIEEALKFDVGLFPMFHNQDGVARGNLKAMIYMAAGAAALIENYGENPALVTDGVDGVLAATADEWLQKMEWLATDADARRAIAERGLQTIRERFSAEVVGRQLQHAFTDLFERAARPVPVSAAVPATS